jgi:hypothetical protein
MYRCPYQKKRHTARFSLAGYSGFSAGQNHWPIKGGVPFLLVGSSKAN